MQVRRGQEINIQNINVELVAQMFKNYRSNVLFHLEGRRRMCIYVSVLTSYGRNGQFAGAFIESFLRSTVRRQCPQAVW